jgi:hypothetical protein
MKMINSKLFAQCRDIIIEGKKEDVKELKDWLFENYRTGVHQALIRTMLQEDEASRIYDIFSKEVLEILEPKDFYKQRDFRNSLANCIGEKLKTKYSLIENKETIKGSDIVEKIPNYSKSIKNGDQFFMDLWQCLTNLGCDEDTIALAWTVVLKVVYEYQ